MEVCVDNLISAENAEIGGAIRLELCSALSEGGLTPSVGFLKIVKEKLTIPVFCMLRCRGGDFVYSDDEMRIMLADLESLKSAGADGFVFGALDSCSAVDVVNNRKILKAAGDIPVTFHRAFDEVSDPKKAFELICGLGFKRILTSGLQKTALEGLNLLEEFSADGRIIVMPGSGVSSSNVAEILKRTKSQEFHGSAKVPTLINGHTISVTDPDEVKKMTEIFKLIVNV